MASKARRVVPSTVIGAMLVLGLSFAGSAEEYTLEMMGDIDVRGDIKNLDAAEAVSIADDLNVTGSVFVGGNPLSSGQLADSELIAKLNELETITQQWLFSNGLRVAENHPITFGESEYHGALVSNDAAERLELISNRSGGLKLDSTSGGVNIAGDMTLDSGYGMSIGGTTIARDGSWLKMTNSEQKTAIGIGPNGVVSLGVPEAGYEPACVGIGTNSPISLLHMVSPNPGFRLEDNSEGPGDGKDFWFVQNFNRTFLEEAPADPYNPDHGNLLTLDMGDSSVGIGLVDPSATLHVSDEAPTFRMDDEDENQPDLLVKTDSGKTFIQEAGDTDGDLLTVDLVNGRLGIGVSSPSDALHVNGVIRLEPLPGPSPSPPTVSDDAGIYAKDNGSGDVVLYGFDDTGNEQQLTSHRDPRSVNPAANSSFGDPDVALPFSVHHLNRMIGKGAVVDMAGVVAEVEALSGKSFTQTYDLTRSAILSATDWRNAALDKRLRERRRRQLAEDPEVEIPMNEAWDLVEETHQVVSIRTRTEYRLDLANERIAQVTVEEPVFENAPTGNRVRRLKPGVRFDTETGRLYRQRTLEEIPVTVDEPELPEWIAARIPTE